MLAANPLDAAPIYGPEPFSQPAGRLEAPWAPGEGEGDAAEPSGQGVSVLNIRVDFEDMPGAPIGAAETQNAFFEASEFLHSVSWGQFWFEEVVVTDTYRMPYPTTWYTGRFNGDVLLQTHARSAARDAGHRIGDHWSYSVTFGRISDWSWTGKAWVGQPGIWINGRGNRPQTIAHEFGHNLGMSHAGRWLVDDGDPISPNGQFVPADVFDAMSHFHDLFPHGHFNAYWKTQVGWMDQDRNVLNAFAEGPHRLYAHDFGPGTFVEDRLYAIQFPTDEGPDYWLEFRQAPYEDIAEAGVQIRWGPSEVSRWTDTVLLDMSGGQASYDTRLVDIPLSIGATFADSQAGIEITAVESGVAEDGNWWVDVAVTGLPVAAELDGQLGNSGRFISPVTVTLHASEFRLNDGPWQTYTGPFTVGSDGLHTLEFRSIDAAANIQDVRSVSFEIVTPPVTTLALAGQQGNDGWFISPVTVTLTAIPGSLGVDRTQYALNDSVGSFHPFSSTDEEYTVEFQIGTEGIHTLNFHSTDNDGNRGPTGSAEIRIDTSAPNASLKVDDVVRTFGTILTFDVNYSDNLGLDPATLVGNNQAIRVTGPDGLDTFAEFVSLEDDTDQTSRTATYRLWSPEGTWQPQDGGSYTVSVADDQIADLAGNFVTGATLGSFEAGVLESETPWQNPNNPLDVTGDGTVAPIDALIIINYLNSTGAGPLPAPPNVPPPYLDVSGDNAVVPLDALLIINFLNSQHSGEGEPLLYGPVGQGPLASMARPAQPGQDDSLEDLLEDDSELERVLAGIAGHVRQGWKAPHTGSLLKECGR